MDMEVEDTGGPALPGSNKRKQCRAQRNRKRRRSKRDARCRERHERGHYDEIALKAYLVRHIKDSHYQKLKKPSETVCRPTPGSSTKRHHAGARMEIL